jgi:signal transduction histidine kinase
MSDVSLRIFEFFETHADIHDFGIEQLLDGTGLTLDQASDRNGWVPWDTWAVLCTRFEAMVGTEATIEAGMRIPQMDYSAPTRALAGALARPTQLYEAVFRWLAPLMFRNLQFEVTSPSRNRVHIRATIPAPGAPCRAWMRMAEGSFRTLPGVLGVGDAVVRATHLDGGRSATFDILLPASETFLDQVRRRARIALAPSALLDLLHEMQLDIRQAYREVATRERELRELVEALPDPVALCIGDTVHLANRSWHRALGDQTSLHSLFGAADVPDEVVADGRIYERAEHPPREAEERRLIVLRDVTESRREAQRRMLTDRLTSLGTMAASVGHELNNPLTYVAGAIELLEEDLDDLDADALRNAVRDAVKMAGEGIEQMRHITSDLRLFVRGATSEGYEDVELERVVRSTLRMADSELRGVDVHCELAEGLVVRGRAAQLGQVVLNLVLNAAQAMRRHPEREATLRVTGTRSNGEIALQIDDTGPGLPPDPERLFEPFYTTRKEGTGLGLAICRRLVEEHDGTLRGEDHTDGARFVIRLPAASPSRTEARSPTPSRPCRVLFVDDEVQLGVLVTRLLSDCDVTAFSRPTEALDWAVAHADTIDVVLCDVQMPELSGPELVERLPRSLQERVIWVTGGIRDRETADRLAGRPILDKPFRKSTLVAQIEAMDGGRRQQFG